MAMKDEVKEQQQKLKGKTTREKLEYFWDYYKVHTILALFVVFTQKRAVHLPGALSGW